MSNDLKFQLRLTLNEGFAQAARANPADVSIAPLQDILRRHDATMKCQHDAFADYVSEAEANGIDKYPLYEWTKQTVDDPVKHPLVEGRRQTGLQQRPRVPVSQRLDAELREARERAAELAFGAGAGEPDVLTAQGEL